MLFKIVQSNFQKMTVRWLSSNALKPLPNFDKLQLEAMKERCFLVDENDKIIGKESKRECHLVRKDGTIPLHRAFSVFLFNTDGDLLLQKRAATKITYPLHYTNACCSHPLDDFPGENEERGNIGILRAAQRRLNYELGIPISQIPLGKFKYLTRIHYYDRGNGQWGEHEIDYILFLQNDVILHPNPNEVCEIKYIPKSEMNTFTSQFNDPLTPWFSLILKNQLQNWWRNLHDLNQFIDHKTIHRF